MSKKIQNSAQGRLLTHTNAANQLARECMVTAFMQLLENKKMSEVTITELTAKAGVSRMTFYRNYTTKEDIFIQHIQDIFALYRQEFQEQELNTDFYDMANTLHCFHYFSVHRAFLNSLFSSGMGHVFLQELTGYILSVWYQENNSSARYYTLQAFAGSLYNLYIFQAASPVFFSETEAATIIHDIYAPNSDALSN